MVRTCIPTRRLKENGEAPCTCAGEATALSLLSTAVMDAMRQGDLEVTTSANVSHRYPCNMTGGNNGIVGY